jgi:F0F1-type ATP synthase membrane subunit c/vacuolar-type H+-ATPase subunit K
MMGGMGLMMLVALLIVAIVIGFAIRAGVGGGIREPEPREVLQRRLAAGEITAEDYYERESALRESQVGRRRR